MWAALVKAKNDIPLNGAASGTLFDDRKRVDVVIKEGTEITITTGAKEKYALWGYGYIWDLPEDYVGEIIRVYANH